MRLRELRNKSGFTQNEIANKLGVSGQTILNWENGITAIPAEQFNNLCKLYNIKSDHVEIPIVKDNFFCE